MKDKSVEIDSFTEIIGHMGKWQGWICFCVFLIKFPSAWYQLAIIYFAPNIKFNCQHTQVNESLFDSQCIENCSTYVYDKSVFENTIVSEWNLVCDAAWLKNFTQTVFMFGLLIGSIIFGFLADRYGRRKAFLGALLMMIVFGLLTSFSPSYTIFTVFRFLVGLASAGTMMTSFVICMELVGAKYREIVGILYQIPFNLGNVTLPIFAYYFRTWDGFNLALTLPSLLFLAYFWILPESPRWLIANGRIEEGTKILTIAAIRNKLDTDKLKDKMKLLVDQLHRAGESAPKANFIDLFRSPILRLRTLCSCALWLLSGFYYYGVSQYVSQTSSDIFISVALSGAIQLPANAVSIFCNTIFGRKKTTFVALILSGAMMFIIAFLPSKSWIHLFCSCLALSFASVTFNTIYIYSSELFPTVVRNMGMGLSSMSSRVGSMIAPFIVSLSTTASWLPPVIFGVSALLASISCAILPETKGTKLTDVL